MLKRLARIAFPYGSVRRVLRGPARGLKIVVEPGLGVSYLFATEDAAPRFFTTRLSPGMTVVDAGANKGQMALLFASLVGKTGRVFAFEPAPAEFASLERNVRMNGLSQVTPVQAAVADVAGTMAFRYAADAPTQGKLANVEPSYQVEDTQTIAVRSTPLDDILEKGVRPDLVKIDVEGAAAAVLRGARRVIQEVRPVFFIELHGPEEQEGVRDNLLAQGYTARTLDGRKVPDETAGWYSPLWCTPADRVVDGS